MVADSEDLEQIDATELHARRINAKDVLAPMEGEKFMLPTEDGTVKFSGGDQDLKENQTSFLPTHINNHLFVIVKLKMTQHWMMRKVEMLVRDTRAAKWSRQPQHAGASEWGTPRVWTAVPISPRTTRPRSTQRRHEVA